MPVPTAYTEPQLAEWMYRELGGANGIAGTLGWTVAGDEFGPFENPIAAALYAYHGSAGSIDDATDVRKLWALARREAWRAVVQASAGEHDYGTESSRYSRSQIHKQALASLALAESEAAHYEDALAVSFVPIRHAHDPYVWLGDETRVLP